MSATNNALNRDVLVRLLEKRGHVAVPAGSGQAALDILERELFDVVLMDIQMPDMSGLQVTEEIRRREKLMGKRVPIVAVTAHAHKEDRERCLAVGMDGYVAKPILPQQLFDIVERVSATSDESSVPAASPSEEGRDALDRQTALRSAGGDVELLREMAALFMKMAPQMILQISECARRRDPKALERAAHSFRGAAANFGAVRLVETLKRLEAMGLEGNLNEVDKACAQLLDEWEKLRQPIAGLSAPAPK